MADDPTTDVPLIPAIIDDARAPFFHVDELTGAGPVYGGFTLTFAALQNDFSGDHVTAYRQVNLRLSIPRLALESAVAFLQQRLADTANPPPQTTPPRPTAH